MHWKASSIAPLLLVSALASGCSVASPEESWPGSSGWMGGGIPVDAENLPGPGDANPFAGIDPVVFQRGSLKVAAMMARVSAKLAAADLDPNDEDAVTAAFAKFMPEAEADAEAWLATLDSSEISSMAEALDKCSHAHAEARPSDRASLAGSDDTAPHPACASLPFCSGR